MNLSHNLVQKQTQKIVMTQDLRQSIELLALSTLELSERIKQELQENPFLDDVQADEPYKEPEFYSTTDVRNIEKSNYLKETDPNWSENYSYEKNNFERKDIDSKQKFIESSTQPESLTEYLLSQLRLLNISKKDFKKGELLISSINEKGFITVRLEDLAKESNTNLKDWERIHQIIMELDPIGIGARNIQETLYVQAKILFPDNEIIKSLILNHLNDIERFDYKKISKSLGITEEEILENIRLIRKLQPYPASNYQSQKPNYIIPDVIIHESGNELSVYINDEWIPKVKVVDDYKEILNGKISQKDKEFISSKLNSANWLVKAIQKRRQTLYKTVLALLNFQNDFFFYGPTHIKPLTLKDISEKTGLSESTISRITTNKYIQTKWGIYELKWFFSSSIKTKEGLSTSSKKIQEMILEMIKNEKEESPLSDQDIVDKFAEKGIEIARRTVAKYRKILKIPSSNLRKKTF